MSNSLADTTAVELVGKTLPDDVLNAAFAPIDAVEPAINAFSLIDEDGALTRSRTPELQLRAEFERNHPSRDVSGLRPRHEILVPPLPSEVDRPGDPRVASWLDRDRACLSLNVAQRSAISIPVPADGAPVAVQIVGQRHADTTILRVAVAVEAVMLRLQPERATSSSTELSQMPADGSA